MSRPVLSSELDRALRADALMAKLLLDAVSTRLSPCSLPWTLEPCRNIGIIGIPGTYRLRLNDATAVGTAQVWAEWHLNENIASQVYGAYFA